MKNTKILRHLAGIAAAQTESGYVVHIIDDEGAVFEIAASRENIELMVTNLQNILAGKSGEDAHAQG